MLGPLRDLIKQAITAGGIEPPLTVDVDDPGAVTDFDEPHELR